MTTPILEEAASLPSGVGHLLRFDSFVTAVSDNNEVQQVVVTGEPAGDQVVLTVGGQSTAPIAAIASAPYRFFQWNKLDLAPGTYDLSVNLSGRATPEQYYEVLDDTTLLAVVTMDNTLFPVGNPTPFPDPPGVHRNDGFALRWTPLGAASDAHPGRYTFATGKLHVRVSCATRTDGQGVFDADNLRIATTDGAVVIRLDTALPPATAAAPDVPIRSGPQGFQAGDDAVDAIGLPGSGAGTRYLLDPAEVQAKLQALSSVGSGNLTAAGDGSSRAPLVLRYVAALAGTARALPTCADTAHVAITRVTGGGVFPNLIRNGESPVPVPSSWIYWDQVGQQMATVSVYPPVCSPAVVRHAAGQYDDGAHGRLMANGSDGNWQLYPGGYYNQTYLTAGATPTASWYFGPWKGATYRISASWVPTAGHTTGATYTVRDWAGNTLGAHTVNQTLAPSGDTETGAIGGGDWTVTWEVLGTFTVPGEIAGIVVVLSNGTASTMQANGIRLERTSPDDTFRVAPGDVVTATWGAGWATTTNGPVPAQPGPVTLTNLVGGKRVGDLPSSHSCEIGVNLHRPAANMGSVLYQDLTAVGSDVVAAWPTTIGGSYGLYGINNGPQTSDGDQRNWPNVPPGEYVLAWKGAGNCHVYSGSSYILEHADQAAYPGTVGSQNYRYYTLGGDYTRYGPELFIQVHGTTIIGSGPNWNTDVTDVHLYPLGTDLNNPPKFRPDWLARESPFQCRRHLDPMECITGNTTEYSDFQPAQSRVSKNVVARRISSAIASVSQYTGSAWHITPGYFFLLVTTPSAHPFSDFQTFRFSDDCNAVVHLDDGSTVGLAAGGSTLYVVDATSFVTFINIPPGRAMVGTIAAPSGTVFADCGVGMPLQDLVESFNAGTSSRTFMFNSGASSKQSAIEQAVTYAAVHLKAGARFRHECMNETWNPTPGPYTVSCQMTYNYGLGSGGDPVPFMVVLANRHWGWAKAAWVAAGRDAADFIRVMGSQHGNPGVTANIVNFCVSSGLDFGDEVATAPYLYPKPSYTRNGNPQSLPIVHRMTVEQTLDQTEIDWELGGYEADFQAHLGVIHPHFPDVRAITYEGAPEIMGLSGYNMNRNSHGVVRHPRFRAIYGRLLAIFAANGCSAFHHYPESLLDGYVWPAYNHTAQLAYTPSPEQDAIQIDTPDRMDLLQSVMGRALNDMAGRFSASGTPAPLAAGTVTAGSVTSTTATVSVSGDSGGTSPYSNQLQVTPYQAGTWTDSGSPVTGSSATLTATGLTPSSPYSLRVVVTDSTSGTAQTSTSNAVNMTTSAAGGALSAGSATPGSTTSAAASATATEATGGTSPYAHQWYRSTSNGVLGAAVSGQTTTTLADSGLTASTTYYYTLRYTDGASAHVDSNQVAETTAVAPGGVAPVVAQTFKPFRHVRM